jgi:hypothetical protein
MKRFKSIGKNKDYKSYKELLNFYPIQNPNFIKIIISSAEGFK